MVKPAAMSSVPGFSRSSLEPVEPSASLWMPKMVPTDTGVQVRRPVDRVARHGVPRPGVLREEDGFLLLLGHQHGALARRPHGCDEQVVADHVQLLLVVAGGVAGAGQPGEVDESGAAV